MPSRRPAVEEGIIAWWCSTGPERACQERMRRGLTDGAGSRVGVRWVCGEWRGQATGSKGGFLRR